MLVDDPAQLRLLGRGSSPTWSLLRPPLDLAEHAPLNLLRERRDPELKRFRRLHRVSPHTILYVGPYRRGDGWLHLVLEAATVLRERYDDLVVAALPDGPVDRRYRDACERQAMPLGHRAIVEWQSPPEERALWYALASVVCAGGAEPVVLSAAAGAPAVATSHEPTLPEGLRPELVAGGDVAALTAQLDALLSESAAAEALGAARRRAAEAELTPTAAARGLRALWSGLATAG